MTTSDDCEGYHRFGVYDPMIKLGCIEWVWRPHRRINDYVTCVLQSLRIGICSSPTFGNEYGTQPLPLVYTFRDNPYPSCLGGLGLFDQNDSSNVVGDVPDVVTTSSEVETDVKFALID